MSSCDKGPSAHAIISKTLLSTRWAGCGTPREFHKFSKEGIARTDDLTYNFTFELCAALQFQPVDSGRNRNIEFVRTAIQTSLGLDPPAVGKKRTDKSGKPAGGEFPSRSIPHPGFSDAQFHETPNGVSLSLLISLEVTIGFRIVNVPSTLLK